MPRYFSSNSCSSDDSEGINALSPFARIEGRPAAHSGVTIIMKTTAAVAAAVAVPAAAVTAAQIPQWMGQRPQSAVAAALGARACLPQPRIGAAPQQETVTPALEPVGEEEEEEEEEEMKATMTTTTKTVFLPFQSASRHASAVCAAQSRQLLRRPRKGGKGERSTRKDIPTLPSTVC